MISEMWELLNISLTSTGPTLLAKAKLSRLNGSLLYKKFEVEGLLYVFSLWWVYLTGYKYVWVKRCCRTSGNLSFTSYAKQAKRQRASC